MLKTKPRKRKKPSRPTSTASRKKSKAKAKSSKKAQSKPSWSSETSTEEEESSTESEEEEEEEDDDNNTRSAKKNRKPAKPRVKLDPLSWGIKSGGFVEQCLRACKGFRFRMSPSTKTPSWRMPSVNWGTVAKQLLLSGFANFQGLVRASSGGMLRIGCFPGPS